METLGNFLFQHLVTLNSFLIETITFLKKCYFFFLDLQFPLEWISPDRISGERHTAWTQTQCRHSTGKLWLVATITVLGADHKSQIISASSVRRDSQNKIYWRTNFKLLSPVNLCRILPKICSNWTIIIWTSIYI